MSEEPLDVAIIGAGFSGIGALRAIAATGRRARLFEQADGPGGVWRRTVYPGAACDIPSDLYCFVDAPNPDWPSSHAAQADILAYLESTLAPLAHLCRFGAPVGRVAWCAAEGLWHIDIAGNVEKARTVIIATGPQNRRYLPPVEGYDRFAGRWVHTADWDASLDVAGRRVVIVGSGASAVQMVPALAARAGHLTVVQRSAAWILPRREQARRPWRRTLYRRLPVAQGLVRALIYWLHEFVGLGNLGNRPIGWALRQVALAKLAREVRDPQRRRLLTPDYPIGCKRVGVSDDYWPAFNHAHVALEPHGLAALNETGVVLDDGRTVPCDVVVFATGYRVADAHGFLAIEGADGHALPGLWEREGARAYLGTVAAGFPNLAFLLGPNSGLSHSSAIHVIETQITYILRWLDATDRLGPIAPRQSVQDAYNAWLDRRMVGTVWASGCRSWYIDAAGRNAAIYPGLTASFRRRLSRFDPRDFDQVAPPPGQGRSNP